jgi:hypothetical protein
MTTTARELDLPAFAERLAGVLSHMESSELGLRGLRIHVKVAHGSTLQPATLDCSRRVPTVELGQCGPAHLVVHVEQNAIVPLLAAYSLRDIFEYFEDGSIRLQQGAPGQGPLYTILRMVRDPTDARDNATLRAELQAAFDASMRAAGP